jgi:hypothetical protein
MIVVDYKEPGIYGVLVGYGMPHPTKTPELRSRYSY